MELWPAKDWLGPEPPIHIDLLPTVTRDGVHQAPWRRPPWWKRRQRRWWDQNVRGMIEFQPRFRLRITQADGAVLVDVDDYHLYLILCFGSQAVPGAYPNVPRGTME